MIDFCFLELFVRDFKSAFPEAAGQTPSSDESRRFFKTACDFSVLFSMWEFPPPDFVSKNT